MSAPPKTVLHVEAEESAAIREAVRAARGVDQLSGSPKPACADDVDAFAALIADPRVSAPLYDLPRPDDRAAVAAWIDARIARRERGEGLLLFTRDATGALAGYTDATIWPDRAAGEIGGAMRADRQNRGEGGAGALRTFGWLFESIGVRLMCLTAALDNVRSARLIEAAGFVRMGERDAVRADGTIRPSLYWELTREAWRAKWATPAPESR